MSLRLPLEPLPDYALRAEPPTSSSGPVSRRGSPIAISVIGAARWHAILSRPCQKGAREPDGVRLSAFVPRLPRGGTPVAFPTPTPGGKRQKRHDGTGCDEFRGER